MSCYPTRMALTFASRSANTRSSPELPIIFLSARAGETDRVIGFEVGANDYLIKPFFVRELIARIKTHLRETQSSPEILTTDNLELDRGRLEVRRDGERVPVTATEFKLLEFLMTQARPCLQPRATARRSLGPGPCRGRARRRCVRPPPAPQTRRRPRQPALDPLRPRLRLHIRCQPLIPEHSRVSPRSAGDLTNPLSPFSSRSELYARHSARSPARFTLSGP